MHCYNCYSCSENCLDITFFFLFRVMASGVVMGTAVVTLVLKNTCFTKLTVSTAVIEELAWLGKAVEGLVSSLLRAVQSFH